MSVTDIGMARWKSATHSEDVTPRDTLAEAIRRVDAGEWPIRSVMIIGLEEVEPNQATVVEIMHGGPDTTNERIGVLTRSTYTMLTNMGGD